MSSSAKQHVILKHKLILRTVTRDRLYIISYTLLDSLLFWVRLEEQKHFAFLANVLPEKFQEKGNNVGTLSVEGSPIKKMNIAFLPFLCS